MDPLTPEERSERMSRIGPKDTQPELTVRRLVYSMGYRYRIHDAGLPGRPDLVFRGRQKVIFVHGCFWHQHKGCTIYRMPKSRQDFWLPKLKENKARDRRNMSKLQRMGWGVLVIWECELGDLDALRDRIISFLEE